MKKSLKIFISSLMAVLTFASPHSIYGTEEIFALPQEVTKKILIHTSCDKILELGSEISFTSFYSIYKNARLVCKDWENIIGNRDKKEFFIKSIISAYALLGYEEECRKFLNGKLIYKLQVGSETINLPISPLDKPLGNAFCLSPCGDLQYNFIISTGYRKKKEWENEHKVEIWFTPRFLIEKELKTTASHFQAINKKWNKTAFVGLFWTLGKWSDLTSYNYLTSLSYDELSGQSIYDIWLKSSSEQVDLPDYQLISSFMLSLRNLSCSFSELH